MLFITVNWICVEKFLSDFFLSKLKLFVKINKYFCGRIATFLSQTSKLYEVYNGLFNIIRLTETISVVIFGILFSLSSSQLIYDHKLKEIPRQKLL
jgi:hypothetical protein